MSLRLEIKKVLLERSPRVKALDFHHENSWVILGLYSGTLALHDYSTNVPLKLTPVLHTNTVSLNSSNPLCQVHRIQTTDRMRVG